MSDAITQPIKNPTNLSDADDIDVLIVTTWSLRWLTCMALGALTFTFASAALVSTMFTGRRQISQRSRVGQAVFLEDRDRLAILLLGTPISNSILGITVFIFGYVSLPTFITTQSCSELITVGMASQWYVAISTPLLTTHYVFRLYNHQHLSRIVAPVTAHAGQIVEGPNGIHIHGGVMNQENIREGINAETQDEAQTIPPETVCSWNRSKKAFARWQAFSMRFLCGIGGVIAFVCVAILTAGTATHLTLGWLTLVQTSGYCSHDFMSWRIINRMTCVRVLACPESFPRWIIGIVFGASVIITGIAVLFVIRGVEKTRLRRATVSVTGGNGPGDTQAEAHLRAFTRPPDEGAHFHHYAEPIRRTRRSFRHPFRPHFDPAGRGDFTSHPIPEDVQRNEDNVNGVHGLAPDVRPPQGDYRLSEVASSQAVNISSAASNSTFLLLSDGDFYDEEQTRHIVQSPPPTNVVQTRRQRNRPEGPRASFCITDDTNSGSNSSDDCMECYRFSHRETFGSNSIDNGNSGVQLTNIPYYSRLPGPVPVVHVSRDNPETRRPSPVRSEESEDVPQSERSTHIEPTSDDEHDATNSSRQDFNQPTQQSTSAKRLRFLNVPHQHTSHQTYPPTRDRNSSIFIQHTSAQNPQRSFASYQRTISPNRASTSSPSPFPSPLMPRQTSTSSSIYSGLPNQQSPLMTHTNNEFCALPQYSLTSSCNPHNRSPKLSPRNAPRCSNQNAEVLSNQATLSDHETYASHQESAHVLETRPVAGASRPATASNHHREEHESNNSLWESIQAITLTDIIFPHRHTQANKTRFGHTRVKHVRRDIIPRDTPTLIDNNVNPAVSGVTTSTFTLANLVTCQIVCVSGVFFVLAYTMLATYLILTPGGRGLGSEKLEYRFTDPTFQPYLVTLLLKACLESIFTFAALVSLQSTQR